VPIPGTECQPKAAIARPNVKAEPRKRIRKLQPLEGAAGLRPLLAECLANDFAAFARKAWTVLHPQNKLVWSWHYDYLCELLTLVRRRQLLRLIINVPPRTLKSTLVTILFPIWVWISEPEHNFLTASYSLDLSTEHSFKRRSLLKSSWFQGLWGDKFRLAADRNQVAQFTNDRLGSMIATSVGASVLGRGGSTLILDDPTTVSQALSDTERTNANNWLDNTFRSRLDDPASGALIVVMQRLHEEDVTGYLLEREPGVWNHVCIPLVAEADESWNFPISRRVVLRKASEVLMPERFPPPIVDELRSRRQIFAGQYQQRPVPVDGNMIKRKEVRYYGGIDPATGVADERLPETFDFKMISVDCAFKDSAKSDYVAIGIIGVKGRKRYLLNIVNHHLDAGATEAEIRRQRDVYRPIRSVLVEDRANGSAIIERLKLNIPRVIAIQPQGGKIARMFAAAPEWQAGDWFVNRNAAWTEPFVEQITTFPAAPNDDMVDMMTQAAAWLLQSPRRTVVFADAFSGRITDEITW
jgi:predicted phage terminase large subunit-like protein